MKRKLLILLLIPTVLFLHSCSKEEEEAPVLPEVTATPASLIIYTGMSTDIALSGSIPGTSFSWTVVQSGVTGASSGNGSSIKQTLSTEGNIAGTVTYIIVPVSAGITGIAVSVTITVTPARITYTTHIKPLLTTSCTPCHLASGYNSTKFDNYATTKNKINGILDRVQRPKNASGFMPQGGTELSAEKIDLLKKWVTDGLLEN